MAGPEDWGAVPQEQTPEDWGAVANDATPSFASSEGAKRYAHEQWEQFRQQGGFASSASFPAFARFVGGGLGAMAAGTVEGIADLFMKSHKAYQEGLTPDEETEFGVNTFLTTMGFGGAPFKVPKMKVPSALEEFHEQVAKPTVQNAVEASLPEIVVKPPEELPEVTELPSPTAEAVTAQAAQVEQINRLVEARELGVLGGPHEPVETDSPAVAAHRAIPASIRQGDKIMMTPAGEPITDFEKQFNMLFDGLDSPEAIRAAIAEQASRNNNFPQANMGEVNPAHVEILAEAAGIDPTKVDRQRFKETFDTPDKVRIAKETMDQAINKFKEMAAKVETEPTTENLAAMLEAEIRRDYVIEETLGLRPEWSDQSLKDLLAARGKAITLDLKGEVVKKKPPKKVVDVIDTAREFQRNATVGAGELGLDKLVKAASDLVDEVAEPKEPKPGEPKPELDPDVKELVKTAQAVVNLMRPKKAAGPPTATVRPLRGIVEHGEPSRPSSPLADLNRLISEAERNVTTAVKEGKPIKQAMPKELADMIDAAANVTSHFGGLGVERAINDLLARKGRTPADMQEIARNVRNLSNEQAARILTNMRGKGPHWLHWAVSQALISGIITHTFYTGTNLMFMELERVIAPTVAAIFDRIRGNPDPILFGEIGAAQRALISSMPLAFQAAKQAFKTGLRVPLPHEMELIQADARGLKSAAKAMMPYVSGQEPNWGILRRIASDETLAKVERYGGIPGRSANFQHTFFKNLSAQASLESQAYHQAAKEVVDRKSQAFADRMAFWKANPTEEMVRKMNDDGYSGTFMEELGEKTAAFSRLVKDTPLEWVFFFTHIPMNIARAGVRYTAPYLGKEMRADMLGKNGMSKQNLAYAKWTVGASIASYFVYKGLMDEATGGYPNDPKERQRWKDMGIPSNSIQWGGQWWSLERLGPVGMAAKLGAEIGYIARTWDHKKDKGLGENITNAMGHLVLAFANVYGTEAGFQGLANIVDLVTGKRTPAEWGAYQGASLLQPISILSQAANFADPHMREAKTLIDGVKMRLPFLREMLPVKRDPVYGDARPNLGYLAIERYAPVIDDPVKKELDRLGYYPTAPQKHIGGVQLTPEQYERYQATAGPLVKKALTQLMESPQWKMHNGQPEWQIAAAKAYISQSRRKAAATVQAESVFRDGPENNLVEAGRRRRLMQINGAHP